MCTAVCNILSLLCFFDVARILVMAGGRGSWKMERVGSFPSLTWRYVLVSGGGRVWTNYRDVLQEVECHAY